MRLNLILELNGGVLLRLIVEEVGVVLTQTGYVSFDETRSMNG